MDDTILKIAMAGLLHDVGKFMQRAEIEKIHPEILDNYGEFCPLNDKNQFGYLHAAHTAYFIEKYVPEYLLDKTELYNGARHHKNLSGDIYKEADCLSAGMERYPPESEECNYKDVRLHSIFEEIELQYAIHDKDNKMQSRWRYKLAPLSGNNPTLFYPLIATERSIQDFDGVMTYGNLWKCFVKEVEEISHETNIKVYFHELLWLLEKYTSCIPSATNVLPDISLYDHAKTTAAIASVLHLHEKEQPRETEPFILCAGDISGIQDYIFRISSIQGIGGIAKRLRGRSFYVMMLGEIIARYIISEAGLNEVNIDFCGGGNFELLLPNTENVRRILNDSEKEINDWLLKEHQGSLGYVSAWVKMTADGLRSSYVEHRDSLADELAMKKIQKNRDSLNDKAFWMKKAIGTERITICPACRLKLTGADDDAVCDSCKLDKDIGTFLPRVRYIQFSDGNTHAISGGLPIPFDKFGCVTLHEKTLSKKEMISSNSTTYSLRPDAAQVKSRYHLAQTVPVALKDITLDTEEDEEGSKEVHTDQTLSFTTIADMAQGDSRIGVLKIDVDHLGLIFSVGLEPPQAESGRRTLQSISRIAVMCRQFTVFFTDVVDQACTKIFQDWLQDEENEWPEKENVSNIFYLIFSGGDDLVIVGPWDRIIDLAREIRREFKSFTCQNPNITLSAGIYLCKPKFPISAAIEKAGAALKQSKSEGRNRITVMEETAVWAREDKDSLIYREELRHQYPSSIFERYEVLSDHVFIKDNEKDKAKDKKPVRALTFEELYEFSLELERLYKEEVISRSFIRRLLDAKETFFTKRYNPNTGRTEEDHNLMCIPHMQYNIARNVKKENQEGLRGTLITTGETPQYIRQAYFPCKRALMKMR